MGCFDIAKLTFPHDRNKIIHSLKLPPPFPKTQMPLASNPDLYWQIPNDSQVDCTQRSPQLPKTPTFPSVPDKNHRITHSPAQRHPNTPQKTLSAQRLTQKCQSCTKIAHCVPRVRPMGVASAPPKFPQSGQICVRVGCRRVPRTPKSRPGCGADSHYH